MKDRRKEFLFRCFLVFFFPILTLFVLENLARLKYKPPSQNKESLFQYHPLKVFALQSNFSGKFADKEIRTNNHGYRDDDFPVAKPTNEIRILTLGDSVTFGDGVSFSATYTEQLENLLDRQFQAKTFQVINTGVPGNGPMQEYYDLMDGLEFEPDAVILQFTLNDVTEPFIFLKRLGGSGWSYHGVRDIPAIDFYLGQHSALYCLAKSWYAKRTYQGEETDTLKARAKKQEIYQKEKLITEHNHEDIQTAWREYFDWLEKIADTCRENQVPLTILISPFEFQLPLSSEQDYPQQKIIQFCDKRNITCLNLINNLRTEFKSQNLSFSNDQETVKFWDHFFHDHDHYSEFGHKYVAELLFPHIVGKLNLSQ